MRRAGLLLALAGTAFLGGCATLQQLAALRSVDFQLRSVTGVRLAGVLLDRKSSWADLSVSDVARLTLALAENRLPLSLDVGVQGTNPPDNGVDARLVRFEWTLLLQDRETVSGVFDQPVVFPPGETVAFPLRVELDLLRFFSGSARDLAQVALSLSGQGGGGAPTSVELRAVPTIDTALGPIRYPGEITILSTRVGDETP